MTTPEASEHLAKALLTLINATAFSIPEKGLSYMCSSLVDRLTKVLSSLDTHSTDEGLSDGESRAWYFFLSSYVTSPFSLITDSTEAFGILASGNLASTRAEA